MIEIKKILVPTDNSPTAMKALDYAIEIAKFQKAKIFLLHVVDERYLSYMSLTDDLSGSTPNLENKMENHMVKELQQTIKDRNLDPEQVVARVNMGRPCEEIITYSDEIDADIIVMGTHGDSGLRRMFIGSVAERVVRRAKRPVLVVRPDEHEFIH